MAPRERSDDDEMDLINAEFNSLVAGLNLDQSTPRTYLDELDEIEKEEALELNRTIGQADSSSIRKVNIFEALRRWWNKRDYDGEDGAKL